MIENPQGKKQEKKEEEVEKKDKEEDKAEQKGQSWLVDQARELGEGMIERTRELFGSDGGSQEDQEQKKEASKGLLGLKLGMLTLGGVIALALGGAIIGLQKLAAADKWFMKGVNSVSPGGMKWAGGKKEKA